MKKYPITLPEPIEWQHQVIAEARRFNVMALGRRAGKTHFGINRLATRETLPYPMAWFAPSYQYMLEVWREVELAFSPIITRKNSSERRMEFVTGGVLDFWTLENPRAGTGRKYKRVIIDEAAFAPKLMDIWNYSIRPTLADYGGDAFFASTPKGRNGFWQMWQNAQDPEQPEWAGWQMPTEVNPYIPRGEIDAMRHALPERVALQELDAQFLDDAGGVFRGVMAVSTGTVQQPADGPRYIIGIDWAFSNDFTVVSVFDPETRQQVYLDRYNGEDYTLQRQRIEALCHRYQPVSIIAEVNSMGRPNNEQLRAAGLPVQDFVTSNASKAAIIESLAGAIERADVVLLNDPVQIGELQAYEGSRTTGGMTRYSAPEGMHDDTVIAAALAHYGMGRAWYAW